MPEIAHVEVSKQKVIINSASSLLTRLVSVTVLVWMYQYLLKRIDVEEYSLLPVVTAVMAVTPVFTTIFTSGLGRFIIEAYAKGDKERVTEIVSSVVPFIMGAAVLILILIGFLTWNIEKILNIPLGRESEASIMMFLLLVALLNSFLLSPYTVGFHVKQKFIALNLIRLGVEILRTGLLLYFLLVLGPKVLYVVIATTASNICGVFLETFISRRMVPSLKFKIKSFRLQTAREVLSFGGWTFFGQVFYLIRTAADPIILNLYASHLDVAIFHIGSIFSRQLESLKGLIFPPLLPPLIALHVAGKKERIREHFYRINKYIMWSLLVFVIPTIIFRQEFYNLYIGQEYNTASTIAGLLFIPSIIGMGIQMVWQIAPAIGKIKSFALISSCLEFSTLLLTLFLVIGLGMGAIGAALSACIIGLAGMTFFVLPLGLKLIEGSLKEWLKETWLPGILPSFAGLGVWQTLQRVLTAETWLSLGGYFLIGALIYTLFLFLFCLDDEDRDNLKKMRKKIYDLIPIVTKKRKNVVGQSVL